MGVTSDRRTLCCRATGYRFHLYVHNTATDNSETYTLDWARTLQQDAEISDCLARDLGSHVGLDIVRQKLLFGYADSVPYTAKFYCTTPDGVKKISKRVKDSSSGIHVYEGDKDSRVAFLREAGLTMCSTVVLCKPTYPGPRQQRFSRCDTEVVCPLSEIKGEPFTGFPPMVVCAYDIETEGLDAEQHAVFQVSLCIRDFPFRGGDSVRKVAISTIPMLPSDDDFERVNVSSERALLETFVDLLTEARVTLLCGWNNLGFDAPFLNKRAAKARCLSVLQRLSFLSGPVCKLQLKQKTLNSSAFGTNVFYAYQGLHGLTEMDGMLMARKSSSLKLNSYKLNNVAKELLKSAKDDVSYDYIMTAVRCRDPEMITKVAKYCVQDSMLVLQIFEHLKEVDNAVVMASLTNVPLHYIAERGQTVKCQSLVHLEAFRQGYIWNTLKRQPSDTKYQGSTVIDSITGLYTDPVVVMDFNSLYPSIMMAYSLSPETLVGTIRQDWCGDSDRLAYYDEGRLYVFIGSGLFAVFDARGVNDAVIPHVLRTLIAERKSVRREMARLDSGDALQHSQLNAKQLALKIMANSIYGTCGFANGPLPLIELAASTTTIGRMSIHKVKSTLARLGYDRVVAGDTDSVMLLIEGVTVQEAIDKANYFCSEHLNPLFPPPMKIEFEKVFFPYLIFTKKRYAGLLWEDANKTPKRDTKGIATKRRDFAPIVSQTVGGVLDLILWKQDVRGAVDYVRGVLTRLAAGELPMEDLTIRKELKKLPSDYKTPSPHSTAAGKMMARDPNNAPRLGERVPFVIVHGQGEVYERAEDPSAVTDVTKLDLLYYTQNQLQNPVCEVFKAVGQAAVIREVGHLFQECTDRVLCRRRNTKYYKQRSLHDFFGAR